MIPSIKDSVTLSLKGNSIYIVLTVNIRESEKEKLNTY